MSQIASPYANAGNPLVQAMIPEGAQRVLDVGCGAGDNARRMREAYPGIEIVGLTHSEEEASIARTHMNAVHVIDLERGLTDEAMDEWGASFDLVIFSHVLEHLTDPLNVVLRCLSRLKLGGYVLIAVPNVLEWRTRLKFLRGTFVYTDHGILDRTHMRFFTYNSAPIELIEPIVGLELVKHRGRGSVPLGPLRMLRAARGLWAAIDRFGIRRKPNLCAAETVLLARWLGSGD